MKHWVDNKGIKEWRLGEEVYELVNWPIRSIQVEEASESDEARKRLWDNLKSSLSKVQSNNK